MGGQKISFASHSEAAGVGACPASVAVCAVLAAEGIIAKPRIKDVASLAFAEASVASAFLAAAFSPAECASKKMPVPAAAAATTTDARQRREVNRSRRPPARLDLSRDARAICGGLGRGRWLVVSSTPRKVLCRIPNATVQSKCWAARSIMLDGANPGLVLRCGGISGIINPVPQIFLREVCVSHALLGRQSQPDRTHSAPTYWLRERLRGPRSVSLLPHIGGIKRMPTKNGPGDRPRRAIPWSQVRFALDSPLEGDPVG
jgi:hypothetical protein